MLGLAKLTTVPLLTAWLPLGLRSGGSSRFLIIHIAPSSPNPAEYTTALEAVALRFCLLIFKP
jgi:hypothetical protein